MIRPSLDALMEALGRAGAPLRVQFAGGLSRQEIDATLGRVPISLAAEVCDYFSWRNGLRLDRDADYELFPQAVPLSLAEAVADYRQQLDVARRIGVQAGLPPTSLWDPQWFPLFRSAGGDYHVTLGIGIRNENRAALAPTAPIYAVVLEDREATTLAYDSLTALVQTVAACVDERAFTMTADGAVEEDRARTGAILRRFNPEMVSQATGWVR